MISPWFMSLGRTSLEEEDDSDLRRQKILKVSISGRNTSVEKS